MQSAKYRYSSFGWSPHIVTCVVDVAKFSILSCWRDASTKAPDVFETNCDDHHSRWIHKAPFVAYLDCGKTFGEGPGEIELRLDSRLSTAIDVAEPIAHPDRSKSF